MSTSETDLPVSRSRNWGSIIATLLVCVCLFGVSSCAYDAWTRVQERARRIVCKSKLKMIGIALHSYHDRYGMFPPAVTHDGNGNVMHSWRALLVPFLEENELLDEVRGYDRNFAWNSDANQQAIRVMPSVGTGYGGFFRCWKDPAIDASHTSFVAVTGEGTIWSKDAAATFKDIPRPGETVVVIEIAESGISWAEPRDIALGDDFQALATAHSGYRDDSVVKALMADGSVRAILLSRLQSPDFRPYFLMNIPVDTPPLE